MRFARVVFVIAGVYGMIVTAPMYFMEARIDRELPPAITHPEYFYGFVGVTLAWQFLFLVLGSDPLRYRPMMLPAIAEKISYVIAVPFLYLQHRIPSIFGVLGCIDCILAVLFVTSNVVTRTKGTQYGEERALFAQRDLEKCVAAGINSCEVSTIRAERSGTRHAGNRKRK